MKPFIQLTFDSDWNAYLRGSRPVLWLMFQLYKRGVLKTGPKPGWPPFFLPKTPFDQYTCGRRITAVELRLDISRV